MKKTLMMALCIALCASLAIGGTMAYLSDTDSDVNVMTLGSVKIEQIEQERNEAGELVDFTPAKPLYPAVYPGNNTSDSIPWASADKWAVANDEAWKVVEENENVVDKFVTVKNTGKSDAYVRTLIAYEGAVINGTDIHVVHNAVSSSNAAVAGEFAATDYIENVVIDGVRYDIIVYTYKNALGVGKTTIPSLKQLYMDHTCNNAEVETYGDTYDVLVVSQAVQTAGFADAVTALNEAFGVVSAESHPWLDMNAEYDDEKDQEPDGVVIPTYPSSADELDKALAEGGDIYLNEDVANENGYTIPENADVTLNMQDNTMTGVLTNNGNLSVNSGTIEANGENALYNEGEATLTDVTLEMTSSTGYIANSRTEGSVTVYENVTATSTGGGVNVWQGEAVFKSGAITTNSTSTSARHVFYVADGAKLTIEDGTFVFSPTNLTRKGSYICAQENATVIVNGGTFDEPSTRTAPIQALDGSTVTIYGGTFHFDPSAFVAEGYQAVESEGWWTVSAK